VSHSTQSRCQEQREQGNEQPHSIDSSLLSSRSAATPSGKSTRKASPRDAGGATIARPGDDAACRHVPQSSWKLRPLRRPAREQRRHAAQRPLGGRPAEQSTGSPSNADAGRRSARITLRPSGEVGGRPASPSWRLRCGREVVAILGNSLETRLFDPAGGASHRNSSPA
jgi:hypothetical protein